jgi:hypothetical protein
MILRVFFKVDCRDERRIEGKSAREAAMLSKFAKIFNLLT